MKSLLIVTGLLFIATASFAQDTLHMMSYNLLNYYSDVTDSATRNPYFRTTIANTHPDILVSLELKTDATSLNFLNGVLLKVDTTYHRAPYVPGPDTNTSLYFLSGKYECNSNQPIHTTLRDINHYTLLNLQTNDTVHIFVVHLKASSGAANEAQRLTEVDSIRKVTDAFAPGTSFIVCGDFNFYSSTEPAYQRLLQVAGTNDGQVIDPITNMTGIWNNGSYAIHHTQSPRTRSFGGGITGGLDDRFDLILFSAAINTNGPLQYVAGSTISYGNDGNHYNDSINHQPNTAVTVAEANALHYAADHLPVMAKFVWVNGWAAGVVSSKQSAENNILIYPNPVSNKLNLFLQYSGSGLPINYTLFDVTGRKKLFGSFINETTIDLSNFVCGAYLLRFQEGENIYWRKVVKM